MGGGFYFSDEQTARQSVRSVRSSEAAFDYSQAAKAGQVHSVHPSLDIRGRIRECVVSPEHPEPTPIVVAMDVTSSRGDDALRVYEQVPSFLGSLALAKLVPDPQIMWVGIGDANSDKAPLQVSQWESDRRLDEQLGNLWMEKGGGGTGEESYELAAYFLANKTKLDTTKQKRKGFVFFTGDEAPYPTVSRDLVKEVIGDKIESDIESDAIFAKLQKKFHTFLVYPRSSAALRKAAIDTEIQQRLERLGGRFKDVDIRASLIWYGADDIDLHCITPAGDHISYSNKKACRHGGELDVDCIRDPKPVENIRWAKGTAKSGKYKFWVNLFSRGVTQSGPIPFKLELDIGGEVRTIEGSVTNPKEDFIIEPITFRAGGESVKKPDLHEAYLEDVVLGKWARLIPASHILRIEDPSSTVEVMLGAMALQTGKMDLEEFSENMKSRSVPSVRRDDVLRSLREFANKGVVAAVDASVFD